MQSDGSYPTSDSNHWVFVVLCQFLREIWYFFSGLVHKLRKCCCGPKVAPGPSTSLTATKRVCLIRHGQGAHNASIKNWKLIAPPLNEVGLAQAAKLCETLKAGEIKPREFDVVCVSPLTRAMQTAKGGFKGTKVPFHVTPLLRERMGAPCDAGKPKSELLKLNPEMRGWGGIDQLEEEWWGAGTGETEWALLERVDALKAWVHARPERTIALVGHGGMFARIIGHHLPNCGHQWVNWTTEASDGTVLV